MNLSQYDAIRWALAGQIIHEICLEFNIKRGELIGRKRPSKLSWIRFIAMHRIRKETNMPFMQIAVMFRRHHSTVMYAFATVEKRLNRKYQSLPKIEVN